MPRPRVHVTAPVPDEVTAALSELFDLVDDPAGADGVLSVLTTRVDGAFLDPAHQHLTVAPEPPTRRNSGLPPALDQVILRALEKKPENRFGSVAEAGAALEEITRPQTLARAARMTEFR